ncbi:hypothetical protein D623_10011158 [Myotis brandtii]|uniref:Uncharacterized protein n=1 Tax=Myotis brandtii TaxID=109478 RepID=S7NV80_MYOBR|nr:hypothetical protein D623_10011158 [Myotis brandtii]
MPVWFVNQMCEEQMGSVVGIRVPGLRDVQEGEGGGGRKLSGNGEKIFLLEEHV